MIVFLDTTELRQNPRMQGVKWEKVRRYLEQGDNCGFVTQLVLDETTNHVREDLAKLVTKLSTCAGTIVRIAGDQRQLPIPTVDVDEIVTEYELFVSRRLQELHFTVAGNEAAKIDSLLRRALNRRKPFDRHGRVGFRDAVQWEVMLGMIEGTVDSVLFVTSNKRDFGPHGSLADELLHDLENIGRTGAVTICEGIDAFVTEFVEPTLERLDDIAVQVGEGEYKSFHTDDFVLGLMPEIESMIRQEVLDNGLLGLDNIVRKYFFEPVLACLDYEFSVVDTDVFRMNEDVVAVTVSIEFKGSITCQEDATGDPDVAPNYVDFTGDATFEVQCGAVINETSGEILEAGVDDVSVQLGYSWPYVGDD